MSEWSDWAQVFTGPVGAAFGALWPDNYGDANWEDDGKWGAQSDQAAPPPAQGGSVADQAKAQAAKGSADMPGGGGNTGVTYLGFAKGFDPAAGQMPTAAVGKKVAEATHLYSSDNPVTEWWDWDEKRRRDAKKLLYRAGYYGDTMPEMSGRVTAADVAAMKGAMTDSNLSGYPSWQESAQAATKTAGSAKNPAATSALNAAVTGLQAFAYENGIRLPDDFIAKKAKQVAAGQTDLDSVGGHLRDNFVARAYPAFADQIKAGMTMRDIAAPYVSTYAQILEVPDNQVDLNDPLMKRALQGVNDRGEPVQTPLWKFEQDLKEDPRWANTDNAWAEVGAQAFKVMQMFGMEA